MISESNGHYKMSNITQPSSKPGGTAIRIRPPNPFNFENLAAKTIYFHPSPFYQKGCIQV